MSFISIVHEVSAFTYTVRNGFARFLSLVGMSLIKVSLDRNILPIICQIFKVAGQEFYQGVFLQFY